MSKDLVELRLNLLENREEDLNNRSNSDLKMICDLTLSVKDIYKRLSLLEKKNNMEPSLDDFLYWQAGLYDPSYDEEE